MSVISPVRSSYRVLKHSRLDCCRGASITLTISCRMSAGRELQVDGAATEKARRASSVCMRGTMSIGASEERRVRGGAWVCTSSLRYVGMVVVRTL